MNVADPKEQKNEIKSIAFLFQELQIWYTKQAVFLFFLLYNIKVGAIILACLRVSGLLYYKLLLIPWIFIFILPEVRVLSGKSDKLGISHLKKK